MALREALAAAVSGAGLPDDGVDAVRRATAAALGNGLSVTELILEVRSAWEAVPTARRTAHPRAATVVERFVSRCIEAYYQPHD